MIPGGPIGKDKPFDTRQGLELIHQQQAAARAEVKPETLTRACNTGEGGRREIGKDDSIDSIATTLKITDAIMTRIGREVIRISTFATFQNVISWSTNERVCASQTRQSIFTLVTLKLIAQQSASERVITS
jgi:hypothetical protein